ncbi:CD209 antigen-like protein A [Branchiostoma floridae x Branchiostoma japonicum]
MPKTKELHVALKQLIMWKGGNYDNGYWIGLEEKRHTWKWMDGSPLLTNHFQVWSPEEPSNTMHFLFPRLCIQIYGNAMWDDTECMRKKWFICQAPPILPA